MVSRSKLSSQRRIRPPSASRQMLALRASATSARVSFKVRDGRALAGSNRLASDASDATALLCRVIADWRSINARAFRSARSPCRTSSEASEAATATIASDIQSARRLLLATKPTNSFSGTTIRVNQSCPAPVIGVTAEMKVWPSTSIARCPVPSMRNRSIDKS